MEEFLISKVQVDLRQANFKRTQKLYAEQIVSEDNAIYIYYASRVEPQVTKEVLKMAGKQNLYEKQLQRIAESMGEDLIPFLSEEVVKRILSEKRVRGLTLSDRLCGLTEEDLRSLDRETQEIVRQLMNNLSGEQN